MLFGWRDRPVLGDYVEKLFHTSLSYRQAKYTMIVGAVLAVLISGVLVYLDLNTVRSQIDGQVHRMLEAVHSIAAQAAYEIDTKRAESAISGIIKEPFIMQVKITDDFGSVLAQSLMSDNGGETSSLVDWLLRGKLEYSEPLLWGDSRQTVGKNRYPGQRPPRGPGPY